VNPHESSAGAGFGPEAEAPKAVETTEAVTPRQATVGLETDASGDVGAGDEQATTKASNVTVVATERPGISRPNASAPVSRRDRDVDIAPQRLT